ncbi:MAG: nuclear transport factor 2 family protein [Bacteroidetes bacterium]|nr:nuclear transport factor 2 family protein [Bacteroidota bacterium]
MKKMILCIAACSLLFACHDNSTDKVLDNNATNMVKAVSTPAVELTDTSYYAIGNKALADFANGDLDSFISIYADDSHMDLAGGDSLSGKANILAFWKKTMTGIDSVRFNTPIYLPIKVNESKQVQTGNYLLMWYNFTLYFKNGKKLLGHTHDVIHLTLDKKIDYQMHFADNAPILAAMK